MPGNWEHEAERFLSPRKAGNARDVLIQTFPPDLPGTFWVHIVNHSKLFQMHHEMYMFASMHSGGGRWICDGRAGGMWAGDTAVFEPGQYHRVIALDGPVGEVPRTTQDVIAVDGHVVHAALDERGVPQSRRHLRRNTFPDPEMTRTLNLLFQRLHPGHDSLERETALAAFVNVIADRALEGQPAAPDRSRRKVLRVKELLRFGFREGLGLDRLAGEAGLSKYHLIRLFTREVGTTPHRFLTEVRLTHARRLMMRGLPAVQVALDSGFSDQSHFIRAYKRTFGVSPIRGR